MPVWKTVSPATLCTEPNAVPGYSVPSARISRARVTTAMLKRLRKTERKKERKKEEKDEED